MVKYLLVGLILLGAAADVDAGAWTLPRGQFWGKLTYFQQHTQEWYVGKAALARPAPALPTTLRGNTNRGPSFSRAYTASPTA